MATDDYLHQLISSGKWVALGKMVGSCCGFAGTFIGIKILGANDYGAFQYILSTLGVITNYASFGLGATATYFVAAQNEDKAGAARISKTLTKISVCISFIIAIIVVICAQWISNCWMGRPDLLWQIRVSALLVLCGIASESIFGSLNGYREFFEIAICNLLGGVFTLVSVMIFTPFLNLCGFILAQAIGMIASSKILQIPPDVIKIRRQHFPRQPKIEVNYRDSFRDFLKNFFGGVPVPEVL